MKPIEFKRRPNVNQFAGVLSFMQHLLQLPGKNGLNSE